MFFPFSIRRNTEFDVVGFGTNAVDHLIRVPYYPPFNSKVELTGHTLSPGGEIASSLAGLARLGKRCSYAGRFGDDDAGIIGIRSLEDEGVDVSSSQTIADAKTQIAFIIVDERSGERTVIWKRDDRLHYTAEEAPIAVAAQGSILHLTPHDGPAAIRMATAARTAGSIVSADVDNLFDGLDELLRLVDVCITSAELPERLLGIDDRKTALRELSLRYGCSVTGLTLGTAGSLIYCADGFVESPGFEVPGGCVDTTGAGDAFRAGFLYGILEGLSVEQTSRCGNGVAALKCRGTGAREALPDRSELETLLAQR